MNSPVRVNVVWANEKLERLPSSTSYVTVARFAQDTESWPAEGWSVALEFPPASALAKSFEATARFLVPDAPWSRLKTGCTFDLYECNRRTATVSVL